MSKTYTVGAKKWSGGWELHIAGEGVTQVRTLDKAADQVRDYLETMHGRDMADATIVLEPSLDGLEVEVRAVKEAAAAAARAQVEAARGQRAMVAKLREKGLSVTDAAVVMGVSRGRVSQLTSTK